MAWVVVVMFVGGLLGDTVIGTGARPAVLDIVGLLAIDRWLCYTAYMHLLVEWKEKGQGPREP
jgi:hypothetical protein